MNGRKARERRRLNKNNPLDQKNKSVFSALARLRKSGLFDLDMDSWVEFFDKNPEQATPGFVSFVISQRRQEMRYLFD